MGEVARGLPEAHKEAPPIVLPWQLTWLSSAGPFKRHRIQGAASKPPHLKSPHYSTTAGGNLWPADRCSLHGYEIT